MRVLSLPANPSQKTFAIASTLLGAVAAAQVLTALYLSTRERGETHLPPERKAAVEARLFPRSKPRPTPAASPLKVPAMAGVPAATVERSPTQPTTVSQTLLQLATGALILGARLARSAKQSATRSCCSSRRSSASVAIPRMRSPNCSKPPPSIQATRKCWLNWR